MNRQATHEDSTISTQRCILCTLLEESYRAQHQVLRTRVINAAQTLVYLVDRTRYEQPVLDQIKVIVEALPKT